MADLGEAPVQIAWREDDRWQVVAWARTPHDVLPCTELHVLNDCGHFTIEDKPAEVGQVLVSFLARFCR